MDAYCIGDAIISTALLAPLFADKAVFYCIDRFHFVKELTNNPNPWLPDMKPEFPSYPNYMKDAW